MAVEKGCGTMQTQGTAEKDDTAVKNKQNGEDKPGEPSEDEPEEETELVEEECDESGERKVKTGTTSGRVVTLQMLLAADILQPGEATMSIEYLGQRFMGDLLSNGKIKSVETDITFASPSAWAIHCKRIINPDKKSGCGWASVRYKGKKLEIFKTKYFTKRTQDQNKENEVSEDEPMEVKPDIKLLPPPAPNPNPVPRTTVKHNVLGNRSATHDGNTLVECISFTSLGKIQPFLISLSTNAALVIDFHCHLTTSEVVGYLGGHWDVNSHNLSITHAFPCRSRLSDRVSAPLVEAEIRKGLERRNLSLVGWYHSHPYASATPTLRDIDSQLEYEMRMKGSSDASYTPCVGIICSPYNKESISYESVIMSFWVMPPPENRPNEYGKPMLMSYSVVQDNHLTTDALNEMKRCADFYKVEKDFVKFSEVYKSNMTYLEKMKNTLNSKFPRELSKGGQLWNYLSELISPGSTGETKPPPTHNVSTSLPPPPPPAPLILPTSLPISIPSANKSTSLLGAELASALFASGKFPSPASLMSLSAIFPSGISTSSTNGPIGILKPLISQSSHPLTSLNHSLQSHQVSQYPISHSSTQSLSSFSHSLLSHPTKSLATQSHGTQSHFPLSHAPLHLAPTSSLYSLATQSRTYTSPSLSAAHVSQALSLSLSSLSHNLSLSYASHSSQTQPSTSHSSQSPLITQALEKTSMSPLITQALEKVPLSMTHASHTTQTLSHPLTSHSLSQPPQNQHSPLSLTVSTSPSAPSTQSVSTPSSNPPTPTVQPSPTPPLQLPSPAKIPKLDENHQNNGGDNVSPITTTSSSSS